MALSPKDDIQHGKMI